MNDNEFDQDKDFKLLHDKYQLESTELPPESVDANILQAAHQAINSHATEQTKAEKNKKSKLRNKHAKRAWYVPMSYVAVMVLSLSVVLKLAFEPDTAVNEVMDSEILESDFAEEKQREVSEESLNMPEKRMRQARERSEISNQRKQKKAETPAAKAKVKAVEARKRLSRAPLSASPVAASQPASQSYQYIEPETEVSRGVSSMPVTQLLSEDKLDGTSTKRKETVLAKKLQKSDRDVLLVLYQTGQFEKLRLAMKDYRSKYPLNGVDVPLPQELLNLEIKWDKEYTSKILHD